MWQSSFPPNLSIFFWSLVRHAIPVDSRIQSKGILFASRCRCCKAPHSESLLHLFIHSKVAVAVWKCFGSIFQLPYFFNSILQAMSIWMAPVNATSQYGLCRVAVAAYILKEIWVARCHATFEESKMNASQICLKVISRVQLLSLVSLPNKPSA